MSGPVTRWWWVRHAPTRGDRGIIRGSGTDAPADTAHPVALDGLAALLPPPDALFVTPLQRTAQTARALAEHGVVLPDAAVEPAFAEQHFGTWEGGRWDGLADAAAAFWRDPARTAPPGGEALATVMARVGTAVDGHTRANAGGDILCVAHAGALRGAVAHALGLTPDQALRLAFDPLGVTRLEALGDAGWRVGCINQVVPEVP